MYIFLNCLGCVVQLFFDMRPSFFFIRLYNNSKRQQEIFIEATNALVTVFPEGGSPGL